MPGIGEREEYTMKSSRISKPVVRSILEKYLDNTMAHRIFWEMVEQDENDSRNVIGMTLKEFKERFDVDNLEIVWADDTNAGFGRAGWTVYGDNDDCVICSTETIRGGYKLHVWCDPLTSSLPWVNAAMKEHHRRHPEEV
jgi:hypothetical protein